MANNKKRSLGSGKKDAESKSTERGWMLLQPPLEETVVIHGEKHTAWASAKSKGGQVFKRHENVLLLSDDPNLPYIAHILYFYLDKKSNTVYMCVNWFYRSLEVAVRKGKKKKVGKLQDYEILYNSHKDFNPADSIIKAVSVTCDAKNMVGVDKDARGFEYLCRYEYHISKNGKKTRIEPVSESLKNQILTYKMIKYKPPSRKKKSERYKAHTLFQDKQVVMKKVKAGRPAQQKKGSNKGTKKLEQTMGKGGVHEIPKQVTKVSLKKRKGAISVPHGKRKKLHEDPYAAKLQQLEQIQLFSKRNIDKDDLRPPLNSSPHTIKNLDQPTLEGLQDAVKQVQVGEDELLFSENNDHASKALSVLHPAGDPFKVDFSYDKQWGMQVGYGEDGRLYVSSVSNNDLNAAKKKGILVGDIVTAINDRVFPYPAPTVHVFFDMVNKARSARQSISISFFRPNSSGGYSPTVEEIGFPKDMDELYTNDIDYISLADHIMSNKRSNNYNLATTTSSANTSFDDIQIVDGKAQSILDKCSMDTEISNDQESNVRTSTHLVPPRIGNNYQIDLPSANTSIMQNIKVQNAQPCEETVIDSSIAPGTSIVIQKGTLVWVGRDSVQNQADLHSSGKYQTSTFMKRHRYFPAFLQTDFLSTNTFVEVGKYVNILRNEAELEKSLGRPLQKIELEFAKVDCVEVKTFDGIIMQNISKIYGYVHKLFFRAKILYSPVDSDKCSNIEAKKKLSGPFEENILNTENAILDIMKKIGKKNPIGTLVKSFPSYRKQMIQIVCLLLPFVGANRSHQEHSNYQYLSMRSSGMEELGTSRYGRVRLQAIPKQLQQEQSALWSAAKRHASKQHSNTTRGITNDTCDESLRIEMPNTNTMTQADPPKDYSTLNEEDDRNFCRPDIRTKRVHRGDVGLNQYGLPTNVYGLNVNLAIVTYPLGSESIYLCQDFSHLRYRVNNKIPKLYDLVIVNNREPAMILGSYGTGNILYKHSIPNKESNVIEYNDKILVKFLSNDIEVDTRLKHCNPMQNPTPHYEVLHEIYKIRLIHGDEAFEQFVSQLSIIEQMLEADDKVPFHAGGVSGNENDAVAKMRSTEIIRDTTIDLAGSYSSGLRYFADRYARLPTYKIENDKIHFCDNVHTNNI